MKIGANRFTLDPMKRGWFAGFCICCCTLSPVFGQATKPVAPVSPPAARPKEESRPAPEKSHEIKKNILAVLSKQEKEWNAGNIDGFMEGYWHSDTLRMVSSRGVTYGFDKIKANYKKSYPDSAAMGKLDFDIIHVELINETNAMVTGKWLLKIDKRFKGGYFTLLFRKMKNKWWIVADHTS